MNIPSLTPAARSFADALAAAGFDAVLVGGAVRDALLERTCGGDLDLITNASPDEIRSLASDATWARRTYPLGERFGTIGVVLADGTTVETTRYRADALGADDVAGRFAADAQHRDFTVNAIGIDLSANALLDPLEGQLDLERGILRAPPPPDSRFAEDPLRAVRAGRFVAELGFQLDPATAAALPVAIEGLRAVAPERIRNELTRLLTAPAPAAGVRAIHEAGVLEALLPEIAALAGVTQPTFHDLDVFEHTLMTVGCVPATRVLRWAALLHDVGKAPTRTVDPDGRIRFLGHAGIGATIAEMICRRLRMSNDDTAAIVHLVADHMRLSDVDLVNERAVDRAVRRIELKTGAGQHVRTLVSAEDAIALTVADFSATAHREDAAVLDTRLRAAIAASRERAAARPAPPPLSGGELMRELGIGEGPQVGAAMRAIEAAIDAGDLAPDDRSGALRIARGSVG